MQTSEATGQALRYLVTGAIVCATYVGGTLALSAVAGVPIAIAIAVAYVVAVTLHFTLQRRFVFANARFALTPRQQLLRYALVGGAQYPLTLGGTKLLPALFGVSEQVAYVVTVAAATACGFVLLRSRVFHAEET